MHARPWRSRSKATAPPVWRAQLGRGSSRSSATWVWVSVSYVTGSFRLDFLRCSCLLNYRTARLLGLIIFDPVTLAWLLNL